MTFKIIPGEKQKSEKYFPNMYRVLGCAFMYFAFNTIVKSKKSFTNRNTKTYYFNNYTLIESIILKSKVHTE